MISFFKAGILAMLASASLHAVEVEMKTVSIDEFFAGQLQPLPLKLDIPKVYVHAKDLEVDESYTYWMLPQAIKPAADTGDLPSTGYVWGKISLDVGYLTNRKSSLTKTDSKQNWQLQDMSSWLKKSAMSAALPSLPPS